MRIIFHFLDGNQTKVHSFKIVMIEIFSGKYKNAHESELI